MADIGLIWNTLDGSGDASLTNGDLTIDNSLQTAVMVSLLTDRLAEADDELPDNSNDRRGWVGDDPLAGGVPSHGGGGTPDLIGSRLWLLSRAKQTTETLRRAEAYALEALAWMTEDQVAGSVTAVATYPQPGWLNLAIGIVQSGASTTYNYAWSLSA